MKATAAISALCVCLPFAAAWTTPSSTLATTRQATNLWASFLGPKTKHLSGFVGPSPSKLESTPLDLSDYQPRRDVLKDKIVSGMEALVSATKKEAEMTFGMLQSDIPVTIVLGTVSAISFGLARTSPLSSVEWVEMLIKSLSWFFGYGYFFDIGNQMVGVEEDKLNLGDVSCKANRPLATGVMSMEGAKVRQVVSGILYLAGSWWMGGTELSLCAILWIVSSLLYNFAGWGDHFVTKNYTIMSSGSIAMLLAARCIAGEVQTSMIPPILAAVWIGLCMDSQDFRDEVGDRLLGRRTTSVLWGVEKARQAWVGMVLLASGAIGSILHECVSWPDAVIASAAVALSIHTLSNKTAKDDHNTYNGICLLGALFFCRSPFWAHLF